MDGYGNGSLMMSGSLFFSKEAGNLDFYKESSDLKKKN